MKNTKRKDSTFIAVVADELFPEDASTFEKEHYNIVRAKLNELGGNWKRLKINSSSIYVSDQGKLVYRDGHELHYKIQNNGYISWRYTTMHRLVCFAFGKIKSLRYDPNNPEEIDHIDENKTNNALTNLRVVSHKTNVAKRDRFGFKTCVKVDAYDYATSKFITTYNSYAEAAQALNLNSPSIYYTVTGKAAQTRGYSFRKHGDKYVKMEMPVKMGNRKVKVKKPDGTITIENRTVNYYTGHDKFGMYKDGTLIKTFTSYAECAKEIGSDRHVVADRLRFNNTKPLRGYTFKYVEKKGE